MVPAMTPEPLDPSTVRVRWLLVDAAAAAHLPRWRAMLDAEELARADRFFFDPDRDIFTAAHALARSMLSRATGLPTAHWRTVKGSAGKPALTDADALGGLRFNISHTHGIVACAIARGVELGVDVEAADRKTTLDIAGRFFAPEEVALLRAMPPARQPAVFFRFWTLKEAFIKATGEGLGRPLDSFSFSFDPLRVTLHPERDDRPHAVAPADWQFFECLPARDRPLALAIPRPGSQPLRVDAEGMRAEEVGPV